MATLRPTRDRIPTQVFTPSKVNVSVKNYLLNGQKAVEKISDATSRSSDVNLQYKHGNIILEFSAAFYLHFSNTLVQHFNSNTKVTCNIHEKQDQSGKVVEQSISVKCCLNQRQQYRINLYNTTCRAEVNGRNHRAFFDELQDICKQMDNNKDYSSINQQIREECAKHQRTYSKEIIKPSIAGSQSDNQSTDLSLAKRSNQNTVNTNKQSTDDNCPKCNRKLLSRGVFCIKGNHWIHYACEKLKKEEIEKLECDKNNIQYICTICSKADSISSEITDMQQHLPRNRKNGNNQSTDQIQQQKRCMPVVVPEIYSTDACGVTGAMAILNEESTIRNQLDDKAPPIEQHSPIAAKTTLAAPISNIRNKTDISSSQSDKELRQKENKLRKMEEELKKEKVIINDAIKDQSHLKSYSLNLEAKVKELENSNRILRMKIVGTQPLDVSSSTTGQKPSNTQDNGPSSCANGHTSNFANGHASNFNTHISTLENNIINDRITHIENTRQLYRQMHDMELQSIQQRLKNLEASLQQQSFRPEYQPCHFNPLSTQHPTSLGSTYMTRMPSHLPHHRPMHPYWPGSPQLVPTHQPYLHRPLQSQIPPHVWNIPPPNYQYRQQTTDTSNKQHSTHQNLQGANLQYGQESVKNIDSSTQHKLDHSAPSSHIMNQETSIQTKPYTEKTSSSLDKDVIIPLNKIEQEKTISEAQLPQILQTDSKKESYILVPDLPKPICIIDDSDMEEVQPQGEATRSDTHLLDNVTDTKSNCFLELCQKPPMIP